ncbi:nucleotidyltransferase domain-containing protein [Pseudomonas sp. 21LCFQ02]|uniref:nucleotidyltransferase domain-containing protein n=1 Tax=Pseudomonas sp. 21LCFQ02 TaxID=2957505 RepID=UPI00209B33B3|nr:nucleotidyltransferase domain-containing protein [Pseudomonas sp. 21LCFQ02]MCO8171533.1 nucleotidyltransferase domain-containing protein [Pseudomonas sp. 21LCFQ02]
MTGPARCPSPTEALAIAQHILDSRYPEAAYAFVAGSIMRGQGTYLSDIDLVVIYPRLAAGRRESFIDRGVPVEAFVHDPGTLVWFIDADVKRGRPSLLNMIKEGLLIGPAQEAAELLRSEVIQRLAQGPEPLSADALNVLRYEITDAIDDLRGERSASEILAIGAMLYPKLVELALRGRGRWYGTGKWAPRLLAEVNAELAQRFDEAFRRLFAEADTQTVIELAEGELAPHGGLLFEGDRRVAPGQWRV